MNRAQPDFARVYSEHVWPIYGFFAYRVGDRQLAEDLSQATFERALRAWSRFDPRRASERTWLLAIARNLLIDHHRRDSNRRTELLEEHLEPPVPGPEERITAAPDLTEALAQLSDRDREIVALRFGGDLNGPEIAEVMDITLANVQQILSRSLRKLRQVLEEESSNQGSSDQESSNQESSDQQATALQNPDRGQRAERDQH